MCYLGTKFPSLSIPGRTRGLSISILGRSRRWLLGLAPLLESTLYVWPILLGYRLTSELSGLISDGVTIKVLLPELSAAGYCCYARLLRGGPANGLFRRLGYWLLDDC